MTVVVPTMIEIAAVDAPIGTPFADLDRLAAEFADIGVKIEWLRKEAPRFRLRIEAFRIAKLPVSRVDYAIFLERTGQHEVARAHGPDTALAAHPVETVGNRATTHILLHQVDAFHRHQYVDTLTKLKHQVVTTSTSLVDESNSTEPSNAVTDMNHHVIWLQFNEAVHCSP